MLLHKLQIVQSKEQNQKIVDCMNFIQVCRKTPSFSYGDIRHVHRSKGKKVKWDNAKRYQIQNLPEQGTAKFN